MRSDLCKSKNNQTSKILWRTKTLKEGFDKTNDILRNIYFYRCSIPWGTGGRRGSASRHLLCGRLLVQIDPDRRLGRRTQLLGSKGVTFDMNLAQIGMGIIGGGKDTGREYGGRGNLTLNNIDTQKLGLWRHIERKV
jgi:hypothetical protein